MSETFCFEGLKWDFTEARYMEAKRLFRIAYYLLPEPGESNPEYERGMANVITERIGLPHDMTADVLRQIKHDPRKPWSDSR